MVRSINREIHSPEGSINNVYRIGCPRFTKLKFNSLRQRYFPIQFFVILLDNDTATLFLCAFKLTTVVM